MTKKTTLLFLFASILMDTFCCGRSLEPGNVGYNGEPDSFYDYYGPGYEPDRYNLGEKVRLQRYGCPNRIVQVTINNFFRCITANPISVLADDTFLFDELGDFYFICEHSLCESNKDRYFVRIGHYEPKSPGSAAENIPIQAPASAAKNNPIQAPVSAAENNPFQAPASTENNHIQAPVSAAENSPFQAPASAPVPISSSTSQTIGSPFYYSRKLGWFRK